MPCFCTSLTGDGPRQPTGNGPRKGGQEAEGGVEEERRQREGRKQGNDLGAAEAARRRHHATKAGEKGRSRSGKATKLKRKKRFLGFWPTYAIFYTFNC